MKPPNDHAKACQHKDKETIALKDLNGSVAVTAKY
jgi:hypothetical protein